MIMQNSFSALSLNFDPLLPITWLVVMGGFALILLLVCGLAQRRIPFWRALAVAGFMFALCNPALLEEQRESVKDVAVVLADQSQSQAAPKRREQIATTIEYLKAQLGSRENLELRVIETPPEGELHEETDLFAALDNAFADVPQTRRAGAVLVTDGEVHDVPEAKEGADSYGPVHAMITGSKHERDRRIVLTQSPAYGIVGQNVTLKYIIEDTDAGEGEIVAVRFRRDDGKIDVVFGPLNVEQSTELPVNHGAQNIFTMEIEAVPDEITLANNRAAVIVNGVRDRLRVLLVSGQPHAGGRTWRDLLTSDPGVDLVHFTILREPEKLDATPQNELSLIAFPFQELFEVKLYDFDLIVFDRYSLNRILPLHYFQNIARYVEEGGALLEASGPGFAGESSVYYTALMNVLPASPTGEIIRASFKPSLSKEGKIHPVTQVLDGDQTWGPWLRQVGLSPERGEILMNGSQGNPLLILDRVGQGRVAQIASDHIWLWARGYEGGGPYTELLRRTVHWLMKEPELEENALEIDVQGSQIRIRQRDEKSQEGQRKVTMTTPRGESETIELSPTGEQWHSAEISVSDTGVYGFENEAGQKRFAVVGSLNPPELRDIKATENILKPFIQESGGGIFWAEDTPEPSVRHMTASRENFAGRGWMGLRENNAYNVTGINKTPLLPAWVYAAILIGLCMLAWWREGRAR